jgi:chromosome segregation ATPase
MATNRQINAWIKQIDAAKTKIATERDRLREIQSDIEDLLASQGNVNDDLENAIAALSELL